MTQPVVLLIMDGWGHREQTQSNAIANALTPQWDELWHNSPVCLLDASGADVGLPPGQMGNSEVGHVNIGSGRIVYQELSRVDYEIAQGEFFKNETLNNAMNNAIQSNGQIHIMGLLSDGGVHSHLDHMHAAIQLAYEKGAKDILVHAFLDGRDTPPQSAEKYIRETQTLFANLGIGRIASLCGRYYAMDRDKRWQRVECAYQMIVEGKGQFEASTPLEALEMAYQRQETDEFVQATVILDDQNQSFQVNDNDAVIFMNFRADRARELSYALANSTFSGFERKKKPYCHYVTLTQYAEDIEAPCAYPPARLINGLGDYLAKLGKKQLRLAETEKYAHVTFFFNGGVETVYKGENRILVPSPRVATYDLKPEMSAYEVTDNLVEAINASQYDLIVCNYANADMVGHTGNYDAAIQAIEALDHCLKRVVKATRQSGMTLLITADHGNADKMKSSESNSAHTAHTTNLVPFVHVGAQSVEVKKRQGKLSDIAPTVLNLMHLKKPDEMTGEPIFTVNN